jgi:DNA-binding HxlR family transcriptional regulator
MYMKKTSECKKFIQPVRDVLDLLGGKWKLPLLIALSFSNKRFKELEADLEGITPRMLTRELRDLEANKLINRKHYDTSPPVIEYSLTAYGKSLDAVIASLREWGTEHRGKIFRD